MGLRRWSWAGALGVLSALFGVPAGAEPRVCEIYGTCNSLNGACNKCPNPPDYGQCCRRCVDGTQAIARCFPAALGDCEMQTVVGGCGDSEVGDCSTWGAGAQCDVWNTLAGGCGDRPWCFQ